MKFGIFDYIDIRSEPVPRLYDERIALIQAAEAAGFYGYHVTEHHATPLSAAPSPSVFLAAAARETSRIRLGALLFLLPLYHPFRLLEELQMLDNLSHGRLDIGVGRGVSPFEFAVLSQDIKESEKLYAECLEIVWKGLKHKRITHQRRALSLRQRAAADGMGPEAASAAVVRLAQRSGSAPCCRRVAA